MDLSDKRPAAKRYRVRLASVGNPDFGFGQYAPVSPPEKFEADTLEEVRNAVSYNGRVWAGSPKDWEKSVEIPLAPKAKPAGLTWSGHVKICRDCKRPFRVSDETLCQYALADVAFCLECVTGTPEPGERVNA